MSNRVRNIILLFFSAFIFQLFISCHNQNEISILYDNWLQIENAINEQNEALLEEQFDKFCKSYFSFLDSDIYNNFISINNSNDEKYISASILIYQIGCGINEGDLGKIRTAIFSLEQLDKNSTFNSNQNYIFLNIVLIILCILITIGLFICLKKYEKKQAEAKQLGIYSRFMIKGIETERKRISKDIHDTVLQDMKALNLKTEVLMPEPKNAEEISKNQKLKNELFTETADCMKKLRAICNNLTPSEFRIRKLNLRLHNYTTL